jgi:AbrB family looped-hinge helix DNA binding protein
MESTMNEHSKIPARSKLTSKGQTTVPKEVRSVLKLREGALMEWIINEQDGTAIVRPKTLRAVDLAGFLGKPPNGRHVTIEEMNDAIAEAVTERFRRATGE